MLTTTNYNFKKPELTDSPPDITATNDNWDTLDTNLKDAQDKAQDWNNFKANGGIIGTAGYVGADENGLIIGKSGVDYSKVRIITSSNYNSLAPESNTMTLGNSDKPWKTLYLKTGKLLSPSNDEASLYIQANPGVNVVIQSQSTEGITGDLVLVNNTSEMGFRPTVATTSNTMDLGKSTITFKDLWLGKYSRLGNGYSKLPNGLILQWGYTDMVQGFKDIAMPMTFPNTCFVTTATVSLNVTKANAAEMNTMIANSRNTSESVLQISLKSVSTTSDTFRVKWIAIGY